MVMASSGYYYISPKSKLALKLGHLSYPQVMLTILTHGIPPLALKPCH